MLIVGIWTLIRLPQPWWDRSGYAKALQVWSAAHCGPCEFPYQ
jgi:hypothetical protein